MFNFNQLPSAHNYHFNLPSAQRDEAEKKAKLLKEKKDEENAKREKLRQRKKKIEEQRQKMKIQKVKAKSTLLEAPFKTTKTKTSPQKTAQRSAKNKLRKNPENFENEDFLTIEETLRKRLGKSTFLELKGTPRAKDLKRVFSVEDSTKKLAENLALFVFKNGMQFENVVKQKNRSNPSFGWLFGESSAGKLYYHWKLSRLIYESEQLEFTQNLAIDNISCRTKNPQTDLDDLHEISDLEPKPKYGRKWAEHEKTSYKAAPPPPSLSSNSRIIGKSAKPRPHMFSVIGVHKAADKKRRRFTETPAGDVSSRNLSDIKSQIDFYAEKADRSSQRTEVPKPPKIDSSSDEDEAPLNTAKRTTHARRRGGTGRAKPLDRTNIGHTMLQKMGWKEGTSLGRESVGLGGIPQDSSNKKKFDAFQNRMIDSYKRRPNPLNNPRKSY